MKQLIFIFTLFLTFNLLAQTEVNSKRDLEKMMEDNSINFYTVVNAGEAFFNTIDKNVKGSGYKPFLRWINANEYKFAPDGNRSQVDPYFAEKQYSSFLKNNPTNKALFNGNWKDLGPYTIDSITGHYSAGLGRIEDFFVDPTDSNKIYLGSRSGGFWRTNDGGATWQVTSDFLMASGVNAITASPFNSDSILINVRNSRNGTSYGIYKSADGGLTFTPTFLHANTFSFGGLGTNFQVYEIAYHPRVANMVFVATNEGMFRSTNNLQSVSRILPGSDFTEIAFHPSNNNIIYAYASNGTQTNQVFRSVNGGVSFQRTGFINSNNGNTSVEITTSPQCDSCLYFASDNGVWISTDESLTWQLKGTSTQDCDGFAVNDLDSSKMIIGALDLDNSVDGGATFNRTTRWSLGNTNGNTTSLSSSYKTSNNYIHADVRNAKSINGVFYVATDGFLCKSNDNGVTWQIISEGVGTRENYKLGLSQSNHFRTISGSQDNGTSILTENGWVEFYGADGMEGIIHPLNDDWMMGSVQFGTRRKTINGGETQTGATPSGSASAYWEAPLAFDPNNPMTIYDFRSTIYKSTDFGETHTNLTNTGIGGNIDEAEIAYNNSNIIVITRGSAIRKSFNGGSTFVNIKSNLPSYTIEDIAFDPNNDDVIIAIYGRYQADNQKVYITTNGGSTWSNITFNLGSMPIRSVVIDHTDSSNIYLGAEIGVFTKSMAATTWSLYNPGFPNTTAKELEINFGSNTLRTATWGRGLWEYNLVGRADYPAVMETFITNPPTLNAPKVGVDQFVTSKVHYDRTLSSVYVEWSRDSAVFGNVISMTNTVDSTWVSNAALPQFAAGTKMYFRVLAVGANNDTTETYKFMYEVRAFENCAATGNNSAGNLYLDNVTLRSLNNNTLNNAYTLYTNPVVELYTDSTYTLDVSANTGWGSNDFSAWIDFNADADFDVSERILFDLNAGGGSIMNFTVPTNAKVGDTATLRVRLSYWSSSPEPCGNAFGEVEDYKVFLRNTTTSIPKQSVETEKVKIFPNPNNGNFSVFIPSTTEKTSVQLYNSIGKLIAEKQLNGLHNLNFDLELPSGLYFISVASKSNVQRIPVVIGE